LGNSYLTTDPPPPTRARLVDGMGYEPPPPTRARQERVSFLIVGFRASPAHKGQTFISSGTLTCLSSLPRPRGLDPIPPMSHRIPCEPPPPTWARQQKGQKRCPTARSAPAHVG